MFHTKKERELFLCCILFCRLGLQCLPLHENPATCFKDYASFVWKMKKVQLSWLVDIYACASTVQTITEFEHKPSWIKICDIVFAQSVELQSKELYGFFIERTSRIAFTSFGKMLVRVTVLILIKVTK